MHVSLFLFCSFHIFFQLLLNVNGNINMNIKYNCVIVRCVVGWPRPTHTYDVVNKMISKKKKKKTPPSQYEFNS